MNKDVGEARVSAVQGKLSLREEEKEAFEDAVVKALLDAGRRDEYIWLPHVIFSHVQMTCQLLLNYTRHLD